MLYVTFCYAPDTEMLRMASARIRELDSEAVIYAVNDAAKPIRETIDGVVFLSSDFPRGGNLNGLAVVAGELAMFDRLLRKEGADFIVKFDCDLWANDLTPFLRTLPENGLAVPDYLSVERFEAFKPSGMIYRLSRWMVARLLELFNARSKAELWTKGLYPEDLTIYALAQQTRLLCELIPFASGFTAGMHDGGPGTYGDAVKAGVVHCGEPLPNGARVTREHATLRMKIIKAETK